VRRAAHTKAQILIDTVRWADIEISRETPTKTWSGLSHSSSSRAPQGFRREQSAEKAGRLRTSTSYLTAAATPHPGTNASARAGLQHQPRESPGRMAMGTGNSRDFPLWMGMLFDRHVA